jgi:ligand-binding sensor domain-containing protein
MILICILHYEGPVNLARRIGLWWLEVAENMEARHMKEHEEIVDRIFKIKGFNK